MPEENKEVPNWAKQIAGVRKRLKMSQEALAKTVGTSQTNVAKWERGAYKPSPQMFMALASAVGTEPESMAFREAAGVPRDYFMGKTAPGMVPLASAEAAVAEATAKRASELAASGVLRDDSNHLRYVPLLHDAAAAGTPRMVDEDAISRLIPVPSEWLPRGGMLYGLPVSGDSMDPIVLDGHIVLVDIDQNEPRKLVNRMVVARDQDDGITVKWLREDDGDYYLVPQHVSVRHPVRRLRPGMAVIGRVMKWIGEPPEPPRRK